MTIGGSTRVMRGPVDTVRKPIYSRSFMVQAESVGVIAPAGPIWGAAFLSDTSVAIGFIQQISYDFTGRPLLTDFLRSQQLSRVLLRQRKQATAANAPVGAVVAFSL